MVIDIQAPKGFKAKAKRGSLPTALPSNLQRLLADKQEKKTKTTNNVPAPLFEDQVNLDGSRRASAVIDTSNGAWGASSSRNSFGTSQLPGRSSRRSSLGQLASDDEEEKEEQGDKEDVPPDTITKTTDKEHFTWKLAMGLDDASEEIIRGEEEAHDILRNVLRDAYKVLMPMTKIDHLLEVQQAMEALRNELYPAVKLLGQVAQEQITNAKASILNYNRMQAFARKWAKMSLWKAWKQWLYYISDLREQEKEQWKRDAVQRVVKRWMNQDMHQAFQQWRDNANKAAIRRQADDAVAKAEREKLADLQHKASMVDVLLREKREILQEVDREKDKVQATQDEMKLNEQKHRADLSKVKFDTEFAHSLEQKKLQEKLRQEREHANKLSRQVHMNEEQMKAWREKQMEKIINRMMKREMVGAWEIWHEQWKETRDQREKLNKAVRRMMNNQISGAFNCWCSYVEETKKMRGMLKKAAQKMLNRTLGGAFQGWKDNWQTLKTQRAQLLRVATKVLLREQAAAFSTWADMVEEKKRLTLVMERVARKMLRRQLSGAWERWVDMVDEAVEMRNKMNRTVARIKNVALAGAFDRWVEHVSEAKRMRAASMKIVKKMMNRVIAEAWDAWWEFHEHIKETGNRNEQLLRQALRKMKERVLSMAWERWLDFLGDYRTLKAKALQVVAMIKNRCLVQTFKAWWEYIEMLHEEEEAKMERARRFFMQMMHGTISECFYEWRDNAQELAAARREEEEDKLRLEREKIEAHQRALREAEEAEIRAERAKIERMERVVTRMLRRHMSTAWNRWLDRVDEEKALRAKLRGVMIRMQKREMAGAFGRWHDMMAERKIMRRKMHQLLNRMKNAQLVGAFNTWYENAMDLREERVASILDVNKVRYAKCETIMPLLECMEAELTATLKLIRGRDDILNHKNVIEAAKGILRVVSWGTKHSPLSEEELVRSNGDKPMSITQRKKDPNLLFTTADVNNAVELGVDLVIKEITRLQNEVARLSDVCKHHMKDINHMVDHRKDEHHKMSALMRQKLVALFQEGEDKLRNRLQRLAHSMNTSNWFNWLSEINRTTMEELGAGGEVPPLEDEGTKEKLPAIGPDGGGSKSNREAKPVVAQSTSLYFPPFHAGPSASDRNTHHISLPGVNPRLQHIPGATPGSSERSRRILHYSERLAQSVANDPLGRSMPAQGSGNLSFHTRRNDGRPDGPPLQVDHRPHTEGGVTGSISSRHSLGDMDSSRGVGRPGSESPAGNGLVSAWSTGLPLSTSGNADQPIRYYPQPPSALPKGQAQSIRAAPR